MENTLKSFEEHYITTFDNPYDYFDEYKKWKNFDVVEHDYNTEEIYASILKQFGFSMNLSPALINDSCEQAMDQMVAMRPGFWIKATRKD